MQASKKSPFNLFPFIANQYLQLGLSDDVNGSSTSTYIAGESSVSVSEMQWWNHI